MNYATVIHHITIFSLTTRFPICKLSHPYPYMTRRRQKALQDSGSQVQWLQPRTTVSELGHDSSDSPTDSQGRNRFPGRNRMHQGQGVPGELLPVMQPQPDPHPQWGSPRATCPTSAWQALIFDCCFRKYGCWGTADTEGPRVEKTYSPLLQLAWGGCATRQHSSPAKCILPLSDTTSHLKVFCGGMKMVITEERLTAEEN